MENDLDLIKDESIVIADECGDSMWDAVLEQEVKACKAGTDSKNAALLAHNIDHALLGKTLKN